MSRPPIDPAAGKAAGGAGPAAPATARANRPEPVVVVGARGFVGSAFVRLFAGLGVECRAVDVENYGDWAGEACPCLIHAAGNSRKYLADTEPAADFEVSVGLIPRVLRDYRPERMLLISSVDVYNRLEDPSRTGEDEAIDPLSLSPYGFHKFLAELCVRKHAPRWMIFRLAGMVGPGLRKNPVYDVLHDQPQRIHPDSRYQFMSTDDVARIVWRLAGRQADGEIFNVCGRGLISPREVAALAGRPLRTELLPDGSAPRIVHAATSKLGALLEVPETPAAVRRFLESEGALAAPAPDARRS